MRRACLAALAMFVLTIFPVGPVFAAAPDTAAEGLCRGSGGTLDAKGNCVNAKDPGGTGLETQIKTVVNVFLFLGAAVAVIMIIVAGFKYVTSGGDQAAVKSAKNTILYAVIGLIVMVLAFAAVDFVLDALLNADKTKN